MIKKSAVTKVVVTVVLYLALTVIFCTSCGNKQPYQEYLKAYHQLKQVSSLIMQKDYIVTNSENVSGKMEEVNMSSEQTYKFVRNENGDFLIEKVTFNLPNEVSVQNNIYYTDGYMYSQNISNPKENFSVKKENRYAMLSIMEGIINFPKNVISKQTAEDTSEGRLLSFEFDSEKYYNYLYPESLKEQTHGYREPPLYTVLLDDQQRIKKVTGRFLNMKLDTKEIVQGQEYIITIIQYGGVALEFSERNKSDYLER